jgi:hypothetical protein
MERLLSEQFIGMVGPTFKASAHAWSILTVRRWSFKPFASPIFAIASATRSSAFCIYCVVAASSIHATSRSTTTPCRTRLAPTSPSRPSTASSSSDGYQSPPTLRSGGCRRGSPPRVRRLATSSRSWRSTSVASPSTPGGSSARCSWSMGCSSSTSIRTASNRWWRSRRRARGTWEWELVNKEGIYSSPLPASSGGWRNQSSPGSCRPSERPRARAARVHRRLDR